ncbi:unnamed protein product [Caenorhabditis angaria]|uniref:Serpentine receptor class gamma n=1 Tax=Caenorhabditis angaria TaxID=860376 RepID=A0A9P1MVB8_9PELO|nr:unnamed protein product [Caenorhabditis angaria]
MSGFFFNISALPALPDQPVGEYCPDNYKLCTEPPPFESQSFLCVAFLAPLFITIFDFSVQLTNVFLIIFRKYQKKGPFFAMLLIMSGSILIRCMSYFISTYFTVMKSDLSELTLQISLYLEFCSGFFSEVIIFLMSLNRCLCFVSRTWNERIFEGNRYLFAVFITLLLSISATYFSIKTSEITRIYNDFAGFVNASYEIGWNTEIARIFYIFPIGATFSYLILFLHLKKQSKLAFSKNSQKGEQKVFTQLLITVVFYGMISLVFEILTIFVVDLGQDFAVVCVISLNILNYMPEILLSLIFLTSSLDFCARKTVIESKKLAPKTSVTVLR